MKHYIPIFIFVFIISKAVVANVVHVPQDTSSIQGGISLASAGDTVLVSEGIYSENISFNGKAITVASLYILDGDTSHIENTIIDGSSPADLDKGSVVSFIHGEDTTSVLYGLTIRGGTGSLTNYGVLRRWGGGVQCYEAGAKLVGNHIIRNHCSYSGYAMGGGVCTVSGRSSAMPHLVLEGNRITDNRVGGGAEGIWAFAGGVEIWNVTARIEGNVFARDSVIGVSGAEAGALDINGNPGRPTAIIKNNDFINNVVYGPAHGAIGGAIELAFTNEIFIENNLFKGNKTTCVSGSVIWAQGGAIGITDQDISDYGEKFVRNNRFIDNSVFSEGSASNINGGAIHLFKTWATISGNEIINNSAGSNNSNNRPSGAGIATYESRFTIENNLITGNMTTGIGGGIDINRPQPGVSDAQQLLNNTIYANQSQLYGPGVSVRGGAVVNVMNNIIRGNTADRDEQLYAVFGSIVYVNYNDIEDGYEGTGNIDADPLFLGVNDFHLSENSPCIGAGIGSLEIDGSVYVAPAYDIEGNSRPDPQGSMPDMGAYESPIGPDAVEIEPDRDLPLSFMLDQNYPNPFNPSTTITYQVPNPAEVELSIYNLLGQKVATLVSKKQPAGQYQVEWDASGLASGIYYYMIKAGEFRQVKKMVLVR